MLEYFLESDKFDLLVALDEKSVDQSFYGSSSGDLECYCMKFNDSPSNSRDVSVAWKKKNATTLPHQLKHDKTVRTTLSKE